MAIANDYVEGSAGLLIRLSGAIVLETSEKLLLRHSEGPLHIHFWDGKPVVISYAWEMRVVEKDG